MSGTKVQRSLRTYAPAVIAAVMIVVVLTLHVSGLDVPVIKGVAFVIGLGSLAFGFIDALVSDIRHTYVDPIGERVIVLAVMVLETVLMFASVYLELIQVPGQILGLQTPLDAVYFTMTTLMTIGFGDISAEGQLARGVVLVQMLFTVLVLSSSVRLFTTLTRGVTREVGHDPRDDPHGTPR